jgi:very-short-patch-repair endonuclease
MGQLYCLSHGNPQNRGTGLKHLMREELLPYNPKLKAIARYLRQNMTVTEIMLWQRLKGKQIQGYDFDRQKPIDEYIVDFYCKKLKLAIEIDGAFHDSEEAQEQDRYRQSRLEAIGVRFLRFRDEDVRLRLDDVVQIIECWVLNPPLPNTPSK